MKVDQGRVIRAADEALPAPAFYLGLMGIAPQLGCVVTAWAVPALRGPAIAAGVIYAALILSFLGGLWWMLGLAARAVSPVPYILAVLPSLAGWMVLVGWQSGWIGSRAALFVLVGALTASPLVDRSLSSLIDLPRRWLALRWVMATGLAGSCLLLAIC